MIKLKQIDDNLYYFRVKLADDAIDRDNERFTLSALLEMADKYIGRTLFMSPYNMNLTARIFDTELETDDDTLVTSLMALVSVRFISGLDRRNFESFLKTHEECSISCSVAEKRCSICGKNVMREHCKHEKGKTYGIKHKIRCVYELSGINDIYEWAFVEEPMR